MSIVFLISMIIMTSEDIAAYGIDFFIVWALFSIADAAWFGRFKK